MESLYFVISYLCHRTCRHCYEDRFRPYHGAEQQALLAQSIANVPRIIANLPDELGYWHQQQFHPGRIILAGGEVLLAPVRQQVLYPALAQLRARYGRSVELVVQTTGDLLTKQIIQELDERTVDRISVAGLDHFHEGLDPVALQQRLVTLFAEANYPPEKTHFFGATPESWIGPLWPRGRAWNNSLTSATLADNFCNRWSGGLHFLDLGQAGSEVSIDPDGNVYPCCLKTHHPVGNLLQEPLAALLQRLRGNPVFEAINAGQPEKMGLQHGWSVDRFLSASTATLPNGQPYANLCLGCDRFFREELSPPGATGNAASATLVQIQPSPAQ